MAQPGVYVYGLVPDNHPGPGRHRGVGAPAAVVRLIRIGRLAAVVSTAPAGLRARRRDLMAHQELLLALSADGPVLPMRFGMVSPDEATVLRQLESSEKAYLSVLRRLGGRLEMNLKAVPVEHSLQDLVLEDNRVRRLREHARKSPGYEANLWLGEAVAKALARRAAEAAATVGRELASLAEGRTRGPEVAGFVSNTSFLVARSQIHRFRAAVERLATEYHDRVELRLAGPLPCYSFVGSGPLPHRELTPAGN
jgi:hypothetical protein